MSTDPKLPDLKTGDTFEYQMTWKDENDVPLSLEGVTITAFAEIAPGQHNVQFVVEIDADPASGIYTLKLDPATTAQLFAERDYFCDVNFIRDGFSRSSEDFILPVKRGRTNALK